MKRFQESSCLVKLWRYRYYLAIPFKAIRLYRRPWYNADGSVAELITWDEAWSIAIGTAQGKMKWYYTMEEVRERAKHQLNRKRK